MSSYSFQWEKRDGAGNNPVDIPGATQPTFTIPTDGSFLGATVGLRASDGATTAEAPPTGVIGSASALLPAPPPSYHASGSVAFHQFDTADSGNYGLFFPTFQKIVRTSGGVLFAACAYHQNFTHDPTSWRLWRSNDGGATWATVWDSAVKGDPQYGICPAIEIDENDNIYVLANYLAELGESYTGTKMYKFLAANNWAAPSSPIDMTPHVASGKWSTFLDQTRKWIWIVYWSFSGTGTNLIAVDYNGNQVYARNMWPAYTTNWSPSHPGAHGGIYAPSAHYPIIFVDGNGVVYVGWNNLAMENGDFSGATTSFYDVRLVFSESSTQDFINRAEVWQGPQNGLSGPPSARSLPLCTDDSGAANQVGYPIPKQSLPEFISGKDSNYGVNTGQHVNYNRVQTMVFSNGKVFFRYETENSGDPRIEVHHPAAAFDMGSFTLADALRRTPEFHWDVSNPGDRLGGPLGEGSGGYCQDTTMASRLYFVGVDGPQQKITAVYTDDGGQSWWLYGQSGVIPGLGSNGLLNLSMYRWVGSDGVIAGSVARADGGAVYAFTITPI